MIVTNMSAAAFEAEYGFDGLSGSFSVNDPSSAVP